MTDLPNPPMPPTPPMPPSPFTEPARPANMFQTWVNAVTKPNEANFAAMAGSPNARMGTAIWWVFLASLISSFFLLLAQGTLMRRVLEQQGLGSAVPARTGFLSGALGVICGAPVAAVIAVIGFVIMIAIVQFVARMFGGRGTFDQLAYVFAAIVSPLTIVSGLLALLSAIPYVGACFGIISFVLWIYQLVLEVTAAKGVNGFGWGAAVGSVLIPWAVLALIICCLALAFGALFASAFGNVFSGIGPLPFPTP